MQVQLQGSCRNFKRISVSLKIQYTSFKQMLKYDNFAGRIGFQVILSSDYFSKRRVSKAMDIVGHYDFVNALLKKHGHMMPWLRRYFT